MQALLEDFCQWESHLRAWRRAGKLSDAQIQALDAIGMAWDVSRQGHGVLDPKECAEIVHLYLDEEISIRALSAAFGCSYGTIRNVLSEAGVQPRGQGWRSVRRGGATG